MFNYCPYCGTKNEEKKDSFLCKQCGKHFYQNSKPTATVIPIYKNKELLVGVRGQEPQKGKLDFLGGFLNNGEDPLSGAIREMEEETGFLPMGEDLEYLGIWIDDYEFEGTKFFTFNVIYVLRLEDKVDVEPHDDVVDLKWVSLDENLFFAFKSQNEVFQKIKEDLLHDK